MLEELSSALNNYYRTPSCKNRNPSNLILVPIGNNNMNEKYQKENLTANKFINNSYNYPNMPNFSYTPNFYFNNKVFIPNFQNKENINFFYKNPNLPNNIPINNYNNNINLRPKSAMKARRTKNNGNYVNNGIYSLNEENYNNIKRNKKIKYNKSSLNKKIKFENESVTDDDYDINQNMNKFEEIVNSINSKGFHRYKDEINDRKIIIAGLENSIAILKNKINICKNNVYNGLHKEAKNKIKYENLLSVSNRYKNIGKTADSYKNDINDFQNRIDEINNETFQIKSIAINEQNYIDFMNEEIRKGNKGISDKKKEIENLLPALQLLKNHIKSIKQKISYFNNTKNNYIEELNSMENNI